jgi:hypothetical protein
MPDFKVRRKILGTGGIDITGVASFSGGIAAGSAGAAFNDIVVGTACLNCPSAIAHSVVEGASLAVTGLADADYVFVCPTASLETGMAFLGASGVTGGITASWINATSGDVAASADVHVNYLAFS